MPVKTRISSNVAPLQRATIFILSLGMIVGGTYDLACKNWIGLVPFFAGLVMGALWFRYLKNYPTVWIEGDSIIYSTRDREVIFNRSAIVSAEYVEVFVKQPIQIVYFNRKNDREAFCFLPRSILVESVQEGWPDTLRIAFSVR